MVGKNYTIADAYDGDVLPNIAKDLRIPAALVSQIVNTMQIPPAAYMAINFQLLLSYYQPQDNNLARFILKIIFGDKPVLAFIPNTQDISVTETEEAMKEVLFGGSPVVTKVEGVQVRLIPIHGKVLSVQGASSSGSSGSDDSKRPLSTLATHLYGFLNSYVFDENDLKDLAFRLGVEWDQLVGNNKATKAQSLLRHCDKHEITRNLQAFMVSERPKKRAEIMSVS